VIDLFLGGSFGRGGWISYPLSFSITVGLPFTLILLTMCVTLYMGLSHEKRVVMNGSKSAAKAKQAPSAS
jgi:BCCT family betaine/carnitine transporter